MWQLQIGFALWIDSFVVQLIKALTSVCVCVSNGATQETFRVVHQIKVHICVLWEAMYYMFTSGGQCTIYLCTLYPEPLLVS